MSYIEVYYNMRLFSCEIEDMDRCQLADPKDKGDQFAYIIEQVDSVSLYLRSTMFEM